MGARRGAAVSPPVARTLVSVAVLAVIWAVAFQVTDLPFFPLIAGGGIVTGLAGLWVRRAISPAATGGPSWPPGIRLTRRHATLALVVAVLHLAVSHALFAIGSWLLPALVPTAEEVFGRAGELSLWWALLLGGVVTAPLEEVFWRGAAQPLVTTAVTTRMPRLGATPFAPVVLGALAYAAFHAVTGQLALVAAALLGGLVWGWLLEHTRSVGTSMLAHGLWAVGILVLPPL
jgi:membrane protease YdiL (CAAX protease family)